MTLKTLSLTVAAVCATATLLPAQVQFQHRPGELELTGRMMVRPLQTADPSAAALSRLDGLVIRHFPEVDEYVIQVPEGMDEDTTAAWLMSTGDYEYVHPDWLCFPVNTPNDSNFNQQWHHQNMESELGWDTITDASTVIAAYCDTGVDTNHPDLVNNLIEGYNQVDGLWQNSGGDLEDINGHGTYVAGCIGAEGNNGIGVAGVAWRVQLMPIRVSNSPGGGAYLSDITDGARVAIDNGAKTASASYTGVQNTSVETTGTYIKGQGGLFLYAADNYNQNHSSFDWADVVVVGATDQGDNKAGFSSFGTAIDCVAPGVGIETTSVGGGYSAPSGTSFSTPLTNGVLAMIFANNPGIGAQAAEDLLYANCDDIGAAGEDSTFGHGRVNLRKAVEAGSGGGPYTLTVGPIIAGGATTFAISGASPFALQAVSYSFAGLGSSVEPVTGETLGIANARPGFTTPAGIQGDAVINLFIPNRGVGRNVWIQAAESGAVSNIVASSIQ